MVGIYTGWKKFWSGRLLWYGIGLNLPKSYIDQSHLTIIIIIINYYYY